jgi:hypothetical protein
MGTASGIVAKSTHAGIPWLWHIRQEVRDRVHFWPFDGWQIPEGKPAIVEVYPSIFSGRYDRGDRTADQLQVPMRSRDINISPFDSPTVPARTLSERRRSISSVRPPAAGRGVKSPVLGPARYSRRNRGDRLQRLPD